MSKHRYLLPLAMILVPLTAAPGIAQAPPAEPAAAACPPGTQYVPPGRDGAGNAIAAYCAEAPAGRGAYDPYTGQNAQDPSARRGDGAGQFIPPSR